MPAKSVPVSQPGNNSDTSAPINVRSESWWQGAGYDSIASTKTARNVPDSSSLHKLNDGGGSKDYIAPSGDDHDDKSSKDSQTGGSIQPGSIRKSECLGQPPQLELVGHTIVTGLCIKPLSRSLLWRNDGHIWTSAFGSSSILWHASAYNAFTY